MTKLSQPLPVNRETGSQQHFKFHDLREIICPDFHFCFCAPYLFSFSYLSFTCFFLIYYQSLFTYKALKSVSDTYWEWKSLCFFSYGYFCILVLDFPPCFPISLQDTWSQVSLACSLCHQGSSWSYLIKVKFILKSMRKITSLLISSLNLFVGNKCQMSQ